MPQDPTNTQAVPQDSPAGVIAADGSGDEWGEFPKQKEGGDVGSGDPVQDFWDAIQSGLGSGTFLVIVPTNAENQESVIAEMADATGYRFYAAPDGQIYAIAGYESLRTTLADSPYRIYGFDGEQWTADNLPLDPQPGGDMSILEGVHTWYRDPATGKYYVSYQLPNSGRELVFEATEGQVEDMFGDNPPEFEDVALRDLLQRELVMFGGLIDDVIGDGDFHEQVERVIALALDDGTMPDWALGDPLAEELLYIAVSESKGADWLVEQLSQLDSFQLRFPGVEEYMRLGLDVHEAIAGHLEMEEVLATLEVAYGGNAERITPSIVGDLARGGYTAMDIQTAYATFARMEDHAPALQAFNEMLEANGMDTLDTTAEMYEFLSGAGAQEMYELYEQSSLREAALAYGLGDIFTSDEIIDAVLAMPNAVTVQGAYQSLQVAAQQILQFRSQIDLGQYGLDSDDLIDLSLGIAPRSGADQAEMGFMMQRVAQEAQAFARKQRVTPYYGFTAEGVPQAKSFGRKKQQSI